MEGSEVELVGVAPLQIIVPVPQESVSAIAAWARKSKTLDGNDCKMTIW